MGQISGRYVSISDQIENIYKFTLSVKVTNMMKVGGRAVCTKITLRSKLSLQTVFVESILYHLGR